MPKFRFRAINSKTTQSRVGTLDAPSLEAAHKHLEKNGFIVEWVRSADQPTLALQETQDDGREMARAPRQYRPTLGDLWERCGLADQSFKLLLATGATLGLVVLALSGPNDPIASKAASRGESKQQISVSGELVKSNGTALSPDDVTLTLRLPQIPFSQSWRGDQVVNLDGRIAQSIDFETRRAAGYAEVLIEKPGFSALEHKQVITSSQATIDLGKLVMEPVSGDSTAR